MAHSSNFLAKGYGSDKQWITPFQLLDDSGNVMFSVDSNGAVVANGTVTSAGSADNNGNITITNSAPFLLLADSTASAKQLKIKCDANLAQLRETGDADNALLVLDLANDRVGIGGAPGSYALDVTGATHISTTLTLDGASTLTGAITASSTLGLAGNLAINTNKFTVTAASGNTLIAGTLAVTGAVTLSAEALATDLSINLTAKTSGGQDTSTTSNHFIDVVSTVTSGNDSFTLPAATGSGRIRIVSNQAASNSMQLFGIGSDTVNGATNTVGIAVAAKKQAFCVDYASGKWLALVG